jgi:hypothetical protein
MLTEFNKTHFVNVTSTGLFLSRWSPAMARDAGSIITIAPTNEVTHLRVGVVLIKTPLNDVRASVPRWIDESRASTPVSACKIKAQTGALFPHDAMTGGCSTCTK